MSSRSKDIKRKRMVMLQIIIIAAVIIAAALLVAFFVFGGKHKAKKAAETYMDGIAAQNLDTVLEVTDSDNDICEAYATAFTRDDETISDFKYEISDCSKASDEDVAQAGRVFYEDEEMEFDKAYLCIADCSMESTTSVGTVTAQYEIFCYKLDGSWYALRLR